MRLCWSPLAVVRGFVRTKENERERTKKKVIHKTNQVTVNTEDSERDRATQVWEKCILLLSVICRR